MSHYTIGYHDTDNKNFEIGEYAEDAFEAALFAKRGCSLFKAAPPFIGLHKKAKIEIQINIY